MAKVFVFAEQRNGKLKKAAFELIGAASAAGHETHAILMGDSVESLAPELGTYGAAKVHVVQDPALKFYTGEAYSKAFLDLIKSGSPDIIVAGHAPTGRDLLPRLA